MISVIICSRNAVLDDKLSRNIAQTIGVDHEVIVIDNSRNEYNICTAYNQGVKQSKYGILCFMHDDIAYHTQNWGNHVLAHFNDTQINAIGIAGSPYCAYMPGPWWGNDIIYKHLVQGNDGDRSSGELNTNGEHGHKRQVIILDGVWFCTRKSIFNKINFDGATFKGFHFYDMDICMQIHQSGGKLWCINDVLISHFSMGNVNEAWLTQSMLFHEKWRNKLPATCLTLNHTQSGRLEYKTLYSFIHASQANGHPNQKRYGAALARMLRFKKGYLFYKTPGYFVKFLYRYLTKDPLIQAQH